MQLADRGPPARQPASWQADRWVRRQEGWPSFGNSNTDRIRLGCIQIDIDTDGLQTSLCWGRLNHRQKKHSMSFSLPYAPYIRPYVVAARSHMSDEPFRCRRRRFPETGNRRCSDVRSRARIQGESFSHPKSFKAWGALLPYPQGRGAPPRGLLAPGDGCGVGTMILWEHGSMVRWYH